MSGQGEHIRKSRMDLRPFQKEVTAKIDISEASVWNWERGIAPELKVILKIIEFLGYCPFTSPDDLPGRWSCL